MKRNSRIALGFMVVLVLGGILIGQSTAPPAFTVRLPQELLPETVRIDVEVNGKITWRTRLITRKGIHDYPIAFRMGNVANAFQPEGGQSLSLQIYAPGIQWINRRFEAAELTGRRIFEVPLVKQQTRLMEGMLVDLSLRPIAAQAMTLTFEPGCDNPDCILNPVVVATTTTGRDGTFQFDVPLLADSEAFINKRQFGTTFELTAGSGILQSPDPLYPSTYGGGLQLSSDNLYLTRITVVRFLRGTISGKLGPGFLKQNNLSTDLLRKLKRNKVIAQVEFSKKGGGIAFPPEPDGSFASILTPGTYDVTLIVVEDNHSSRYPIASGVAVEEGKTIKLQIP